ncbi:MAG TPA: protein kinase [Candidatus Angelobacter sp.]|nr:protein kinase [Candidatus Angelobacter sp.]
MKIDPERDHRLMTMVATALQQPAELRRSFLQDACHDDIQLYLEASETLEWEERMGNFLLEPLLVFKDLERPFRPGEVICERFEIVREVGEGGMGVVYEAYDRKRKQRIAIKSAKAGFRRLLTPELESALQVRHANICLVNEIHSADTSQGEIDFLTMEFLDGQSLAAALSSGIRFSPAEALEIARQLCSGLAEAHRSAIIHRDLKSANVILSRSAEGTFRAVITDFGLANAALTGSGELAGTPRYMAPELWRGEPASKASDIYALGVILYELITGCQPFADRQEPASDVSGHPVAPSACVKGLSRRWDAAILPCLDPSPAARPQNATEVLARLDQKPLRKTPLVAFALLVFLVIAGLVPALREPLLDHLRPAQVRLAIIAPTASEDTTAQSGKILQNVSERLRRLRSGGALVAVSSPSEMLRSHIHTAEQAKALLRATHLLQVTLHHDGNDLEVKAAVIDLGTQAHLRDFSGRYAPEIVEDVPIALTGLVSSALRLRGATASDTISAAAKTFYEQGLGSLRKDSYHYDQALPLLAEAARLDPHSPSPLAGIAEAEIQEFLGTKQQRYLEESQQSLSRAEALNPDSVAVHLATGLLYYTRGQYGRALEDYQRVQEIDPGNVSALLRSALIYEAQNMVDKAIENCRKAIQSDPGAAMPYQQLGSFYYYYGKYQLAAEQFQKAAARNNTLVDAHANLGAALIALGREDEAEQALLKSLTLRETARAVSNLGVIRDQQGRDAEAAGYYQRAVALEPGNYINWLNLGDAERRLRHLPESREAFRKVRELALVLLHENPHLGQLRAVVAYAELRLGHGAAAEEEINEALHSVTGNSQVIYLATVIYETLGQRNRAIEVLRGSTLEAMQDINHDRELAALRQDPRFLQLIAKTQESGRN